MLTILPLTEVTSAATHADCSKTHIQAMSSGALAVLYTQRAIAYGGTLRNHRSICHGWGCDLLLLLIPKLGKVIKIL
jgi:hypothetical protein